MDPRVSVISFIKFSLEKWKSDEERLFTNKDLEAVLDIHF